MKLRPEDEALGRALYEEQAKGWAKPLGWDNVAVKSLWVERAKRIRRAVVEPKKD